MQNNNKDKYLTPSEFLEKYPHIQKIWDNRAIGYLLMLKLVKGRKLKRTCIVSEFDVLKIYNSNFLHS